jgi:Trypsin-co-occurring domain 2
LIDLVTSELRQAAAKAHENKNPIMEFDECELEMAVGVETGGSGELGIYVLKLGGTRTKTNSNTVRVTFKKLEGTSSVYYAEKDSEGPESGRNRDRSGEGAE